MYGLDEIIKMNNPKPGDYEKQIAKNKKRNARIEIIRLEDLSYEEKQKKLKEVFEGK